MQLQTPGNGRRRTYSGRQIVGSALRVMGSEPATRGTPTAALSCEKFESTEAGLGERRVTDPDRKEQEAESLESDIVDPPCGWEGTGSATGRDGSTDQRPCPREPSLRRPLSEALP